MRIFLFSLFIVGFILSFSSCAKDQSGENALADNNLPEDQGPARFESLPPELTGLAFSNTISETFQDNMLINSYLYNGGGVGIIDVNNDGLQDLYFSATQESNRLFLNKGNWKFEDITEKAGVAAVNGVKTGVTMVDINADGLQDIYVCRSGLQPGDLRANLLFINNGDLTFSERAAEFGLADKSASNHANFFDFDRDGDLDVYVLNHPVDYSNVNKISVRQEGNEYIRNTAPPKNNIWDSDNFFQNNGNGKFSSIGKEAGIFNRAWGLSVTVSDFNDDQYPDVFVGNDYIEPDLLYINNKNGTFSIQTDKYFRHMSNHTMGVDIADFNNDGLVDVVALDMIAEDRKRQKELMTTMIIERYNNLLRFHYGEQIMRNVLQVNTGRVASQGGVFSEIGVVAGISNTDWSWSPLLADFDNDGFKDLYVTNGYRRDVSNLDYLVYTSPQLAPGGKIDLQKTPTIDDYLKHIPSQPLQNYMFKNVDGLNFKNTNQAWGMADAGYSNGSAYVDLDNDGDLDLLVNNIHGNIMAYKNKSEDIGKSNWLQVAFSGSKNNPLGVGARARITFGNGNIQYQELTPTRGFFSSSQHILHFGLGESTMVERLEIQWPDGLVQIKENIQANQKITLEHRDAVKGNWPVRKNETLFEFTENTGIDFQHDEDEFEDFDRERLLPHRFSNLGPHISVGDVNADGLEDVFIGGAKGQAGALFIQNKQSRFDKSNGEQAWEADSDFEDMGGAFVDIDRDDDLDLFVASGGNSFEANSSFYQDRLYLNDGKGQFSKSTTSLPNINSSASCVSPFDFDNDGDPDIVVGGLVSPGNYPLPTATCFLVNENGNFTDYAGQIATELQQLGMVNALEWADLDGDGQAELVVTGEWLPITVFKYGDGKFTNVTSSFGLENSNGWWNCLQIADLDKDGDMDIVAGNLGLNSRLVATQNNPLRLFAKDFDNNGSIDPVMTYSEDGIDYPMPLRDLLIKQMPHLKKKFLFYKDYSSAAITDVFLETELNSSLQFRANTLATSWFESKNGKYIQHPLPVQAQFAPVNGIDLHDFNKDGQLDILLVGNSSSHEVETGRIDAGNGALFLGNGKGGFEFLSNQKSGFWATKEARGLAKIKLANGQTMYMIANNNDKVEAYILK